MNNIFKIAFILIISSASLHAQKAAPVYNLCGKTGDCTMTWDEFMKCKKELVSTTKGVSVSSFVLTIMKPEKKDTLQIEYPSKGNAFSKQAIESIDKLYKDKKIGNKMLIEAVQVVESGKEARKVPGMVITLTN
ncbi:MAG: hypothetical protein JWP12_2291 [Bacteroidetes bacterium]|nr:hypothetical protein [Bacteroidota bacterium]